MTPVRLALAALGLCVASASPLFAQERPGRIEVSGGVRWIGPVHFGTVDVNELALGGAPRALFRSTTTLDGSIGAVATAGVRLTSMLRAELGVAYNPTHLTSRITADAEGAADTSANEPVTQFLVEGGLILQPQRWRRGRLAPFVTGGVGYLRQLNDGRTLVETGRAYYVGGGMYYERASRRAGRVKATGLRVDVRALLMQDGVAPVAGSHRAPALTATWFARF